MTPGRVEIRHYYSVLVTHAYAREHIIYHSAYAPVSKDPLREERRYAYPYDVKNATDEMGVEIVLRITIYHYVYVSFCPLR